LQEIFSPTQNVSQSQSQTTIPSSQPSPAKPNPFQKSAEDRSAFLKAISRSPSPDRSQTPFTARRREREKRRERENSYPLQSARSPSFDKPEVREERNAKYSQNSSHSYVTPGQRSDHSKERERYEQKETIAQTDKFITVAQIELNRKTGTLTQGTTLVTTIATLPDTTPPTTLTTPLPDIDNIPKSVIVIAMIEIFLMSGTLDAIPHTTITVKIVHHHLMLTPSKEIPL
jgi:hypothetical protein